jgi:hypothetical protein
MPDPREPLGRIVHEARSAFAAAARPHYIPATWEQRLPEQRELDMQIGSVVAEIVAAKLRTALRDHYLAGISCDRGRNEDNPVCSCSQVFLGWHRGRRPAVEAWISHVMEMADRDGGEQERADEKEAGHG